jgi:hypothetical protein
MNEQRKRGARIFFQYAILIALLGGFNFYKYFTGKNILSLIMGGLCALVLAGWAGFYFYYVRGK